MTLLQKKRGIEKGLKEGRKDGLLQGLEKLLGIKFSDTSYMSTIKEIEDENTLNSVFEDAVKSNSIEEFKEKLKLRKLNQNQDLLIMVGLILLDQFGFNINNCQDAPIDPNITL